MPKRHLLRDQRAVAIGPTPAILLGPNPRRFSLLISAPAGGNPGGVLTPVTVAAAQTDGTVLGEKLAYTAPAGGAVVTSATVFSFGSNSGQKDFALTRGANVATIVRVQLATVLALAIPLVAGDKVSWSISGAGPNGELDDFVIGAEVFTAASLAAVSIGFGRQVASGEGINLNGGAAPLLLWGDHVGEAFREEVWAVSNGGTVTVGVVDVSEDCPCQE